MSLRQKIEQEIRERGPIPFSRYIELCLYDPDLGYYSRNADQFGKAGDFYTSSDVHAVFGRLLARQFEEMWRVLGRPEQVEVLELGPGRGLFAQDVLDWSEKKFPDFSHALHYTLAERSASLRARLQELFRERIDAGRVRVGEFVPPLDLSDKGLGNQTQLPTGEGARRSTDRESPIPSHTMRALAPEIPLIVFANEFFDALPVEVISARGALRINLGGERFVEEWVAASPSELEFLDRYSVHPEADARTEATLAAVAQMRAYARAVQRGFLIAIDYGYTREEQLAGRHLGTIMTYREHSASPNPYEAPGEQDITAHVNFSALAAAAEEGGMQVQKLRTQSQFLLGIGEANQFADAFEDCQVPQERAKVALQLKHLVTPAGMGETFHVLVASRGVDAEKMEQLSGLGFGR